MRVFLQHISTQHTTKARIILSVYKIVSKKYNRAAPTCRNILYGTGWRRVALQNQRLPSLHHSCSAHCINPILIAVAQPIEAYRILLMVDYWGKISFESYQLRGIHQYFKYRILHSQSVPLTELGYFAQPLLSWGTGDIHIIGDNHQHRLPPRKRRITIQIAAENFGKQHGLGIGD